MSTSFARVTSKASPVSLAFPLVIFFARATSLSATCVIWIARPARRWISSALRLSTSQVPPPTVPMPSSPTLMGFMSFQAQFQMALQVRPFRGEHAVNHGVAHRAVAPQRMVADDPILFRAQRLDGALRGEIEVVGAQAHDLAPQV